MTLDDLIQVLQTEKAAAMSGTWPSAKDPNPEVILTSAGIMIKTDAGTCSTYRMVILA